MTVAKMARGFVVLLALAVCTAHAEIPRTITACTASDTRIPVRTWMPEFTDQGTLASGPDAQDGDVFYIELFRENSDMECASAPSDKLYSLSLPYEQSDPVDGGGLSVNIRGDVQFANGFCYLSGFFMNQQVMGMHQGWIETYFAPLKKEEVITSGKFCAAGADYNSSPAQLMGEHKKTACEIKTMAGNLALTSLKLQQSYMAGLKKTGRKMTDLERDSAVKKDAQVLTEYDEATKALSRASVKACALVEQLPEL